jgi:hypothetical protein
MKTKKKIILMLVTIIIAISLIVSGLYFYFEYYIDEEKPEKKISPRIDDRISPLTNQAIFFQVQRMRKKGIIDQMYNIGNPFDYSPRWTKKGGADWKHRLEGMRPGIGWDEKPIFNYIAVLDDYQHSGDVDFKTWDTGYIYHYFFRNITDEQPTARIEFKILEVDYKKFRNIRNAREVESFEVIYDFRTGRWEGDDFFNDTDGYGHYNSSKYEVWFSISQTDFDDDGIPWWTEVNILQTDPKMDDSKIDPDHDGCPTAWEWKWGYNHTKWDNHSILDPDKDGLQNIEEYQMKKWLANPFYPEMYIEVDWMERSPKKLFEIKTQPGKIFKSINRPMIVKSRLDGWEHTFYKESQQLIIERFNRHGISVHFDDGRMGEGGDILPFAKAQYETDDRIYLDHALRNQDNGLVSEFYYKNFSDERKGVFRYCVIAHGGGWCHPQDIGHGYDYMMVPTGKEFCKKSMGHAITPRTRRIALAVGVFHELGHSLGFSEFGGIDNFSARYGNPADYPWWEYVSVMNYDYYPQRYFDYSHGTNAGEYDRDEWAIINLSHFETPSDYMEGVGAGIVFENYIAEKPNT